MALERAADVLALICGGDDAPPQLVPVPAADAAPAAAAAPGALGKRRGRRLRLCLRSRAGARRQRGRAAEEQLVAQVQDFNCSGLARTADHMIMPPGVARGRVRGAGRWKGWTAEAVLRVAFLPPTQSARAAAGLFGGGAEHARRCRAVAAACIAEEQRRGLRRLREASFGHPGVEGRPLKFYIRNCMWDETQLALREHRQQVADQSVLAQHMQITWANDEGVTDADLVRPPSVLSEATAATMWAALTAGGDPLGLGLGESVWPAARHHGLLSICDGSAANRLVIKVMEAKQGEKVVRLSGLCAQHSTAAVVEAVTRRLGILSPTFAAAVTLKRGGFCRKLREEVRVLLQDRLAIATEPPELAPREAAYARGLLSECFVSEGQAAGASGARQALADTFLEFFPCSWSGGPWDVGWGAGASGGPGCLWRVCVAGWNGGWNGSSGCGLRAARGVPAGRRGAARWGEDGTGACSLGWRSRVSRARPSCASLPPWVLRQPR
jgi:hypothetical protein